jgi:hypothetical protein
MRTRWPLRRNGRMVHCVSAFSRSRKASIWLSGMEAGRSAGPAKPSTPLICRMGNRCSRVGCRRAKTYPEKSGEVIVLRRSLQRLTCSRRGRKVSVPRSRSSDSTFFSTRNRVCTAYQLAAAGLAASVSASFFRAIALPFESQGPAVEILLVTACYKAFPVSETSAPSVLSPTPPLLLLSKSLRFLVLPPGEFCAPRSPR